MVLVELAKTVNHVIYVRAKCTRQTTWSAKDYDCWVLLHQDRSIIAACCECTGDDGQCKHVIALLLALLDFIERKKDKNSEACTDKACVWDKPRVTSTPRMISDISLQSGQSGHATSKPHITVYNPMTDNPRLSHHAVEKALCKMMRQNKSLDPVALTSLSDSSVESSPDLALTGESEASLPSEASTETLPNLCNLMKAASTGDAIDQNLLMRIEMATRGQSTSSEWKRQRCGRITSSTAHKVLHAKQKTLETEDNYIIKEIFGSSNVNTEATRYGNANERVARELYKNQCDNHHVGLTVETTGLHLLKAHPYIGASPDGLVDCECHSPGLLEIKCPFSLEKTPINTVKEEGLYHIVQDCEGESQLNRLSPFYTQVQVQMAVTGRQWCDFVVYTPAAAPFIAVQRVEFDTAFWEETLVKLSSFFINHIQPKLSQ